MNERECGITDLIQTMNAACGQSSTPVFNHGAEEQNFGFTQSLDPKLSGNENPEWVHFRSGLDGALDAPRKFRSGINLQSQSQIAKK